MSPDGKSSLRDDVAELTEAVRELRDREVAETIRELRAEIAQLRAERSGHCGCTHIHWSLPYVPPSPTFPLVTYSTGAGGYVGVTTTNSTAIPVGN